MTISVNLGIHSYDILIEQGCLDKAGEHLSLDRKVLIVTDDGVPIEYANKVAQFCKEPVIEVINQGEDNKSIKTFEKLLQTMLKNEFTRKDCVVAVGGGICGDLAGFVAASYMRGVDFYNIPTTVLSQVDSSIGGKTAVNLDTIKNVVGAFYQPKKVLIDVNVLKTLPKRHISAGLAEALKMSMTFDKELFELFEQKSAFDNIEEIIEKSLRIKGNVVEQDEKEQGLRKVLNFGHTIGHGIESQSLDGSLYHGECVSIGMIPMCEGEIRERLINILKGLDLPVETNVSLDKVCDAMSHDKKSNKGSVTVIKVKEIGSFDMEKADENELRRLASVVVKGA